MKLLKCLFAAALLALAAPAHAAGVFPTSSNQSVDINNGGNSTLSGVTEVTVGAWVKVSSTTGTRQVISFCNNAGTGERLGLSLTSSGITLKFKVSDTSGFQQTLSVPTTLNLNAWYRITAVVKATSSGAHAKIYLNNVVAASLIFGSPGAFSSTPSTGARIGSLCSSATTNNFRGSLEDIQVYNRALTDSEVANLVMIPGSTTTNLVSRYRIDDLSFQTPNYFPAGSASVPDSAGSYPGTPVSDLATQNGPIP